MTPYSLFSALLLTWAHRVTFGKQTMCSPMLFDSLIGGCCGVEDSRDERMSERSAAISLPLLRLLCVCSIASVLIREGIGEALTHSTTHTHLISQQQKHIQICSTSHTHTLPARCSLNSEKPTYINTSVKRQKQDILLIMRCCLVSEHLSLSTICNSRLLFAKPPRKPW